MKTTRIENSNYSISENGIIINTKTKKQIRTRINTKGYVCFNIYINGKLKHFKLHRLLGLYFIENPNNHPCINHIDGNKLNNNLLNLEWCSLSENTKHAYNLGLIKKRNKFSIEVEKEIVKSYLNKELNQYELAKIYNTSQSLIQKNNKKTSMWGKIVI